jgi:SAM-dependent methyltransferase
MRPAIDAPPGLGALEVARWRAALRTHPWREVLADAATLRLDGRYAAIVDPRSAALLTVLDLPPGARALVVGDRWGQLAVPLARRAAVTVLGTAPAALALLGDMAEQEGVYLALCVGRLEAAPLVAECFDAVLLHAGLGESPPPRGAVALRAAAALLAPGGTIVIAGASPDREGTMTWPAAPADVATAGLVETARFACLPDHQAPEYLIAPPLLDHFLATLAPATWLVAPPTPAWLVFLRREDVQ